jgi:hypothetical protein
MLTVKRVQIVGHELSVDSSHTNFVLKATAAIDSSAPDQETHSSFSGIRVWTVLVRYKQFVLLHKDLVSDGKV